MPPSLVTPGIQAEMHAAINGMDITSTPGGTLHIAPPRHLQQQQQQQQPPPPPPPISKPAVTSVLAETTQAPQFLPPPQAKRARQASIPDDAVPSPALITKRPRKRNKATVSAKVSSEPSPCPVVAKYEPNYNNNGYNSDPEAGDSEEAGLDAYSTHGADGQPLTEDQKRKQFLERNRVAALKCRQRKKKQLQELQDRHDYMVRENEQLRQDYMELREVAMQARAMLAAHSDCPVARAQGVLGVDSMPPNLPAPSLHSLVPVNRSEAEYAKKIIDAIPPTSNGIPVHAAVIPEPSSKANSRHIKHPSMAPHGPQCDPTRTYYA
ncbi:Transcription factor [Coemansia aciculifera]|nr:Transcription factor [Coemansia aciculifera]